MMLIFQVNVNVKFIHYTNRLMEDEVDKIRTVGENN